MKTLIFYTGGALVAGALLSPPAMAQEVYYQRAERLLGWNVDPMISGDEVVPTWLPDENRFWYRNKTGTGWEFVLVDPARSIRSPVFDHSRLAAAMSLANDTSYIPEKLPFTTFEFFDGEGSIAFRAADRRFTCDLSAYRCVVGDTLPDQRGFTKSPDGQWEAFIHEYDLYVRPAAGGDSVRLTRDGVEYYAYGIVAPRPSAILRGDRPRPMLQWSPDSRKIAVQRTDERNVLHVPLYSSTPQRPRSWTFPYAQPGDSIISQFDIYIVDVESRTSRKVDYDRHPWRILGMTGMMDSTWVVVKWSKDSQRLYFTHATRGSKRVQLMVTDLLGSAPQLIAKDTSDTWVELKHGGRMPPNWAVARAGQDLIWFSQRDGWAHLYRFGPDGTLKNQITKGAFAVDEIKHVDDAGGHVYFTGWGGPGDEFPYYARLYRVNLDGSGLTLLTPEAAHHQVTFSPSGRYFMDSYSTVTEPPVTVLRATDGRTVLTLETADVSRLLQVGWRFPEPFRTKARDGVTDIYGIMFKPSHFDSTKQYPIIENIYPGPQVGSVRTWGFDASRSNDPQAVAELGVIVVMIDHMGTPWRSKAFHDTYYGNMGDNGLPDHVAALRQLGTRHSYIDLDRVGIYGHSGGGFASTDAIFRYPDVYHVAVSTAGNHDNRTYGLYWGEKYQGLLVRDTLKGTDNYENQVNYLQAKNLKGKLFLMHGDLDDNVHPAMTMQVVDALIKANKSFDLLMVPDRYHGLNEPYVIRRRWDYFVEHLLGEKPPENYEIVRPEN